ncbi:MAG: S-methyl-5-thioribose-1-phosphate isomerase, partial [Anaerolineaceae bacterium]|nr:S-methyl-5-thioribose-1-phosphate isomerase [Anaerolineaceae bacterium]
MRSVFWEDSSNQLKMIDQRSLPAQLEIMAFDDHLAVADAITNMTVRGAPAIGAAAGFGLVLAGLNSKATQKEGLLADLQTAADVLLKTRPTAVNLSWAINNLLGQVKNMPGNVMELQLGLLDAAKNMADSDIEINKKLAQYGADLIQDGDHIVHHCNTGALAVVDWGTALGV